MQSIFHKEIPLRPGGFTNMGLLTGEDLQKQQTKNPTR